MELNLTNQKLSISLDWVEQLLALSLTNRFEIPVAHITHASTTEPQSLWTEIRAPGVFLPGVVKAGTYYTGQGKEFWYVAKNHSYLTIELQDEPYHRIVLTIDDNEFWAERINETCRPAPQT